MQSDPNMWHVHGDSALPGLAVDQVAMPNKPTDISNGIAEDDVGITMTPRQFDREGLIKINASLGAGTAVR